jgi:hypothetical protein
MKTLVYIVLALSIAACGARPVTAQTSDAGKVQEIIDRNAELLDQASALVHETGSVKARGLLATATALHKQSVELMGTGTMVMAGRVAIRAREVIQQTIAAARRDARFQEQATRLIERALARLEQSRMLFEETGRDDQNVRRLLLESADNLHQAREQMQEHMFETSLHLAEVSLALSTRAMRLLQHDGAGFGAADEFDRTQRLLDRLSDVRSGLPVPLQRLADQAVDLHTRAMHSAEQGNNPLALEQTRAARNLALRALRGAGPADESAQERAFRAVMLTDETIEGARSVAADTRDATLARRIEEASRQQEDARRALDASDFERAIRLTTAARERIREAIRDTSRPVDSNAVESALARTDEALMRARAALERHDDADARALVERATARQHQARRALDGGDPRRALALTKVAFELARNALDRLGDARG